MSDSRNNPLPHPVILPDQDAIFIGDVHQNIEWLMRIIDRHSDMQRFVLMGDLLDRKKGLPFTDAVTALRYYQSLVDDPRFIFLWGNHDISAFAYWMGMTRYGNACHRGTHAWTFPGSDWEQFDFSQIADAFWRKFQPLIKLGPYVISHAGIHEGLLPGNPDEDDLEELAFEAHELLWNMGRDARVPPVWGAGAVRGGREIIGGIAWQDFNHEFYDSLPWPQVVGHTPGANPRRIERSINIDCAQRYYADYRSSGLFRFLFVPSGAKGSRTSRRNALMPW